MKSIFKVMRVPKWSNLLLPLLITIILIIVACGKSAEETTTKVPVPPSSSFFEKEYPLKAIGSKEKFAFGYNGNDVLHSDINLFMVSAEGDTFYRGTWKGKDILPDSIDKGQMADEQKTKLINEALEKAIRFPESDIMNKKTKGKKFLFALPKELFSDRWMWLYWDDKMNGVAPFVYYFGQKPHDEEGAWVELEKILKKKGMI